MDIPMLSKGLAAFTVAVTAVREALGALKAAKDLMPDGAEKAAIEANLVRAERAAQLAEVQGAQALGYPLCKCTFPPQIMLSIGSINNIEHFECPMCHGYLPPQPSNTVIARRR